MNIDIDLGVLEEDLHHLMMTKLTGTMKGSIAFLGFNPVGIDSWITDKRFTRSRLPVVQASHSWRSLAGTFEIWREKGKKERKS